MHFHQAIKIPHINKLLLRKQFPILHGEFNLMLFGKGAVYNNNVFAGVLEKTVEGEYIFRYDQTYFDDSSKRAISLTLPKTQQEYRSPYLFPFFSNMLSEGENKKIQCRMLQIAENDDFTHLLKTAHTDTIGSVTVKEL